MPAKKKSSKSGKAKKAESRGKEIRASRTR